MKLILFSLFIISFIYLSQTQEILKPTTYSLDYLENFNTEISCQSDNDCPEYSKCVKRDDGSTASTCKFGSFLCPKEFKDYFTINETVGNCTFVNTDVWDLDKENFINGNNNENRNYPILKICPNSQKCKTEKCTKDEDCFSGLCRNNVCVRNYNLAHEIYRCTGINPNYDADDIKSMFNVKCGKQLGMYCNSNNECYSGICASNYCSTKKAPSPLHSLIKNFSKGLLILAVIYIVTIITLVIYDYFNGYESDHYWRSLSHFMKAYGKNMIKGYIIGYFIVSVFFYFFRIIN